MFSIEYLIPIAMIGCVVSGTLATFKRRNPLRWALIGAALPLASVVALAFVKDGD
jgi:hypothetical protein